MGQTGLMKVAGRTAAVLFIVALLWVPAIGFLYGVGAAIGGLLILSPIIAIQLPLMIWLRRRGQLPEVESER
jgi:hypothetical protein